MPEYRHIANLTGPAGPAADEVPGTGIHLPIGIGGETSHHDIDALEPGVYYNVSNSSGEELGLPGGARIGVLEVVRVTPSIRLQRYHTNLGVGDRPYRMWVRGMDGDRQYTEDWIQVYPHAGEAPAQKILELAERDGWTAVYDPSDPERARVRGGKVEALLDGLGNLQHLEAGDDAPDHLPGEFGQLAGMGGGGYLTGSLGRTISQPVTYLTVARSTESHEENRYLFSSGHSAWSRVSGGSRQLVANGGANGPVPARWDSHPHVVRLTYDGSDGGSMISVDGQPEGIGRGINSTYTMTLGAHSSGDDRRWAGTFGPFLILEGEPDEAKIGRMTALLMGLGSVPVTPPRIAPGTVAYSEDSSGEPEVVHGDPDRINDSATVASITKVMTLWVARKHLSDDDMFTTVTVSEEDDRSSPRIQPGDELDFFSLMTLAARPSDNTSPRTLAREVGQIILDNEGESGDPESRFVEEMNSEAEELGYEGANFRNPQFGALMSARHVADLFRRSLEDEYLRAAHVVADTTVEVVRDGETITVDVPHTIEANSPWDTDQITAGKTGTNYGFGHVVAAWRHPDGTEHVSVVLNASSSVGSRRYRDLFKLISRSTTGGGYSG